MASDPSTGDPLTGDPLTGDPLTGDPLTGDTGFGVDPDLEAGFVSVDAQPDPSMLFETMDQTAEWTAVKRLRAFEAAHLALAAGDDLLDVGCGVGSAAQTLVADLAPGGRLVGIDASEAMIDEATRRAAQTGIDATYRVGDAMAIDEPDGSFDACRCERVLQWVPDPDTAVAEMVRVLRGGGRLSLVDTDWRTFLCDIPDTAAMAALTTGLMAQRGAPALVGSRLLNIGRDLGIADLALESATHTWTEWNPDTERAPAGFFPIAAVVPQLADLGFIDAEVARTVVDQVTDAARRGRFFMSVTMFAVAARKP